MTQMKALSLFAVAFLLISGCGGPELLDGDPDKWGCYHSDGYEFDSDVGACAQRGTLDQDQKRAAAEASSYLGGSYHGIKVTGVEILRCPGCFTVLFEHQDRSFRVDIAGFKAIPVDGFLSCMEAGFPVMDGFPRTCRVNETYFEEFPDATLDQVEARKIAEMSDCVENGVLSEEPIYDPQAFEWRFGLDTGEEGCDSLCVVSEATGEAVVVWGCD